MIQINRQNNCDPVLVFAETFEYEAFEQIKKLANYMPYQNAKIRIMPDAHAGKGGTIGTTMVLTDAVTPNLVGVDIGCGMLCVELDLTKDDLTEEFLKKLDDTIHNFVPAGFNIHKQAWERCNELDDLLCWSSVDLARAAKSVGTLGGGNHFIELNISESTGKVYLVIHTGSRNLGVHVCNFYQNLAFSRLNNMSDMRSKIISEIIDKCKAENRKQDIQKEIEDALATIQKPSVDKTLAHLTGADFNNYIHDMEIVQNYASLNRKTIARIITKKMKLRIIDSFETIHNYIDTKDMILRKGAISAKENEIVLIPMNMRDGSLICKGKGNPDWNYSAPHGAGRLMSRGQAKKQIRLEDYVSSMAGIYTTSVNYDTLDESPMVYKPMEEIMRCIEPTVEILDIIKPVYNFKASETSGLLD